MYLAEIEISNFRNLQHLKLELGPGFNVLYGDNGAGKTSFLEAIYYLALGRSFRSHISRYIIQYEEQQLIVFARVVDEDGATIPLGISRTRKGESELRVAGEAVNTQAQLAHLLPLQLINSSSYQLLEAGPKQRRQFIDWGMFHVEHSFLSCWQRAQRTLKQRNAILKQGDYVARAQIQVWDQELVAASQILHDLRSKYVIELIPIVQQLIETLLERTDVTLEYYPGWDISRPLGELLQEHLARDLKLGYTTIGPQKADLRIRIRSLPVQDVLSRGQQ
ncbi:MAG: DNA replication/repair protein RecF, partial [Gammaproteobacteria bacterium]|nr:DNA replication/repair protein RecF [Gammaproteobacteria bacterium]